MFLRHWLSDVFCAPAGEESSSSGGASDDWKAPYIAAINDRLEAAEADEVVEPKEPVAADPEQEADDTVVGESADETLTGDEDSVPKSDDPVAPVVDEAREDILALAASYGLGAEETKSFASRAELEKALVLLDRHLLATGGAVIQSEAQRQALLNQPAEQPTKAQEPANAPVVPASPPMDGGDEIAAYVNKLEELGYDQEVIAPIKALYARVQSMESERDQRRRQAFEQHRAHEQEIFNSAVDALSDRELFGTRQKQSEVQRSNIDKLIHELHVLRSGLHATGRDPSLTKELVSRAYRATFGKTIEHRGRVEKSKALIEQGKSRMGSSTRSATPPKRTAHVESGGVHPEVAKWWSENVTNPTAS